MVTPYLIRKITGKSPLRCNANCFRDYYLITGSIIRRSCKHSIIWGAGLLERNETIKKPKEVRAVRGPVTRQRLLELGYKCPEVYGDPALLLPRFYSPNLEKKWKIGIIPHYCDYEDIKKRLKAKHAHVINLLEPVESVIDQIIQCEWTVSSSLHGIIVSHTYGIPCAWVRFSNKLTGDGSKFLDYYLSVGMKQQEQCTLISDEIGIIQLNELRKHAKCDININLEKLMDSCPLN
jgi:hypothetical protein